MSENGCFVGGDVPGKVKDIYFNNVRVNLNVQCSMFNVQCLMDKRPCKGEGFVKVKLDELKQMKVPLVTENANVAIE